MEQNKFDNSIKSTLEKRSIKPSEGTWDKLSQRLDAVEDSEKSRSYWWLGIAASVVGILLLVFQFYKADTRRFNDDIQTPGIVTTPNDPTEIKDGFEQHEAITDGENNMEALVSSETDNPIEDKGVKKETLLEEHVAIAQAGSEGLKNDLPKPQSLNYHKDMNPREIQTFNDIVNNVQAMAQNNQEVTEAYLDSLLLAAEKDIQQERFIKEYQGSVNADALLADVESELDESFRTKVFEAVKSSFNSVKTAVANRNN